MTFKEFDDYSFSIYTQVLIDQIWRSIRAVDFERRVVELSPYEFVSHDQIIDIKD